MSSTDDRIVRMQFDNAQFKKGAADTQKSLADLNKAVDSTGKSKGLMDMSSQMDQVGIHASKMSIVTTAALATIVSKATTTALSLAKSLTFAPITAGFTEYESLLTKQNVIMNATGKSAGEVKGYLNELNAYSDQTIYSFGNMTDSIQKFVNAGVPLPQAVTSIKGIANAAAYAGASAEEANRGMYAFSQSMQTGYIMLQDWMQIENANMGTIQFKETLIDAGVEAGTLTKQGKGFVTASGTFVSATKGWRDGLQDQWATTEVLNSALGKYADTNTKLGKKAFESATQVRTFTAFMDTLKESLASGWAQIFTSLFGNLEQATSMWTGLSNAVGGVVEGFFDFLSTTLKTWRQMGGFEKTIQGFKNLLSPIAALLGAIGDAWSAAFPSSGKGAGKALYGLSAGFELVTRPLQLLADLISGVTPVLTVFFQIIKIGGTILGRVAGKIGDFIADLVSLGDMDAPSGGFLDFIKDIGKAIADAVDEIDDLVSKGASLGEIFGSVDVSLPSMPSLPSLPSFSGGDSGGGAVTALSGGVKDLTSDIFGLKDASDDTVKSGLFSEEAEAGKKNVEGFGEAAKTAAGTVTSSGDEIASFGDTMKGVLKATFDAIGDFFEGFSFEDLVASFNIAVLSTFVLSISRFLNTLSDSFKGFAGVGPAVTGLLTEAGGALKSFQTAAKAKLILNIGIALLLLAAALLVLSTIPTAKLLKALAGLAAVAIIMSKSMSSMSASLSKMDPIKTGVNMIALSVAMIALGVAMILLATAMLIFNKVDVKSVVKGLITMYVVIKLLESLGDMGKDAGKKLMAGAAAILIVSFAMIMLAGALLLFKLVDLESMAKAGGALAGVALAVGLLAKIPYEGIAKVGVALLLSSIGMIAMANALILFALVKWESIAKAIVILAALAIALALMMVVGNPIAVGAILATAAAMVALAVACLILNNVDWGSIFKAALVLGILLVALALGAVILTAFLYAVAPLSPVLVALGLAFALLGLGLLAFAASLAIMVALGPAAVAAFALLATGAAVAIAVFAQTLAAEAPILKDAFLDIMQALIDTIVEAVPMVIDGLRRLWAGVKEELMNPTNKKDSQNAGKSWVQDMADGIIKKMPMITKKASEIVIAFLTGIARYADKIAAAGMDVIIAVINGMSKRVDNAVQAAADLIIKFMEGLRKQADRLTKAGVDLIAGFLHDLADNIRNGSGEIGGGIADVMVAMLEVGVDMVQGMIAGIKGMAGAAVNEVVDMAHDLVNAAKNIIKVWSPSRVFMDIGKFLVLGLAKGIHDNAAIAITSVATMMTGTIAMADELMRNYMNKLDQTAIAARGKASGIASAAARLTREAKKTKKTRADDQAARRMRNQAKEADEEADAAEKAYKARKAKDAYDKRWAKASSAQRANIRATEAKNALRASRRAELQAVESRQEAISLRKASRVAGLTAKQRNELREDAAKAQKQARKSAQAANDQLGKSRARAKDAIKYQKMAGDEAAKSYQEQFDAEKKADEEADAFEKMSDSDKAKRRREQAAELEATAQKQLADAQVLAHTNLAAANALAEQALANADLARDYINEALDFEASGGGTPAVDLQPTAAAAIAFNQYADLFDSAYAAAAASHTVEYNQYNTSPESLSAAEIYRQTHNLLTHAAGAVQPTAA